MKIPFHKPLFFKRKLFIPAGIFSLVLLPLLGFRLLFADPYFHRTHVLEIAFSKETPLQSRNFENTPVILIKGNSVERKQQLDSVIYKLNHIQKNGTDSSLLQINLEEQATWGDFISVINIFKKQELKVYIVNDNKIWVYPNTTYRPPQKQIKGVKSVCGGVYKTNSWKQPVTAPCRQWLCGTCNTLSIPEQDSPQESFQSLIKLPGFKLFIGMFCLLLISGIYSVRKAFFV